jgi:hypothetical protein
VFSLAHTGQLALLRYFLNGIAFNGKPQLFVLKLRVSGLRAKTQGIAANTQLQKAFA